MGNNRSAVVPDKLDTIPKLLQHWAESRSDRELFVFYNKGHIRSAYTCRQVLELSGKFAWRLRQEYGYQKGDVIANTLPNSPERLFTDLGIILAGCVCMNGTTMFADGLDFLTAAHSSGLVAVVACPDAKTSAWTILQHYVTHQNTASTAALECGTAPAMKTAILVSRHHDGQRVPFLKELQDSTEAIFIDTDIRSDEMVFILTTSGSTGYCKLVGKTHAESLEMWSQVQTVFSQQSSQVWEDNVLYNDRPIGWMGGFPYATYLSAEKRVLLDVFDTEGSKLGSDPWDIICREKVDYALIMPTDLDYMLKHTSSDTGYKMKVIACGGQPIRKGQYVNYLTAAHEVGVIYGSTEVGFVSFGVVPEKNAKDYFCNKVRPGFDVRIVDDTGSQVKTGQIGTIEVSGKNMFFHGYFNMVENPDPKTLTSFTKDGWFKMEDSGFFDEDNNLYVVGRLKDIIIFGATTVYPSWLEAKIGTLSGVAEACVVPVSDPVLYHNICAIVRRLPGSALTEDQLRAFCQEMFIFKKDVEGTPIPTFYMVLDKFPLTSTDKTDRITLHKMAETKFGLK